MSKLTYTEKAGENALVWNIDRNGHPFGQIWTFPKAKGFVFNFHAKPLAGEYQSFKTFTEAKNYMEGIAA